VTARLRGEPADARFHGIETPPAADEREAVAEMVRAAAHNLRQMERAWPHPHQPGITSAVCRGPRPSGRGNHPPARSPPPRRPRVHPPERGVLRCHCTSARPRVTCRC